MGSFFFWKVMRVLVAAIFCLISQAVDARALTIDETDVSFGERMEHNVYEHEFRVWNSSSETVSVLEVKRLSGQGEAAIDQNRIAPAGSTVLHVKIPLDAVGAASSRFLINTQSAGGKDAYGIRVSGFVDSIFDNPDPLLDFGIVDKAHSAAIQSYALTSNERPGARISSIVSAPDFVDATIANGLRSLTVKPKPTAVLGLQNGIIKLKTDSAEQQEVWVRVAIDLRGAVVPNQNPLDFGLQRFSSRSTARLQLESRDGRNFKLGKPIIKDAHVTAESAECLPSKKIGCRAFIFQIDKDQPVGQVFGTVTFDLPDTAETLVVNLGGLLLDDKTVIQPMENLKNHAEANASVSSSTGLADALKRSVTPKTTDDTEAPGRGPLLHWQVGNESAIYGYAIMRSDTVDGVYGRANKEIVRAKNQGDNVSSSYQYRDNTAQSGKEYWYYITIFYNSGKKVQLTGPQRVVAK